MAGVKKSGSEVAQRRYQLTAARRERPRDTGAHPLRRARALPRRRLRDHLHQRHRDSGRSRSPHRSSPSSGRRRSCCAPWSTSPWRATIALCRFAAAVVPAGVEGHVRTRVPRGYAHVCVLIGRRSAAVIELVRRASDEGDEIREQWDELQANRLTGARSIARASTSSVISHWSHRVARGATGSGWPNDSAHYLALVGDRSWSERHSRPGWQSRCELQRSARRRPSLTSLCSRSRERDRVVRVQTVARPGSGRLTPGSGEAGFWPADASPATARTRGGDHDGRRRCQAAPTWQVRDRHLRGARGGASG